MTRVCHCDRVQLGRPFCRGRDCGRCWRWHHDADYQRRHGGPGEVVPVAERGRCLHLGPRTERRAGCDGRQCAHGCAHDDPEKRAAHPVAVPACNCQSCPDWEAE